MISLDELKKSLSAAGQDFLWTYRESLPSDVQDALTEQLRQIDWALVSTLIEQTRHNHADDAGKIAAEAQRAKPPEHLVRQPKTDSDRLAWSEAAQHGRELLSAGKVAAVVVAGGQGTRLGFDQPKGMFPIGPVSGHTLFQIFCEQIQARGRQAGSDIPYCVMTSDATHDATVDYFFRQQRFGLLAHNVHFFQQGSLPAVDAASGRVLLDGPGQLALSPDGHGGMLRAMVNCGLLDQLADDGVETLFYHQVDNPTTVVCDPAFLGWHRIQHADVSTKVVAKRSAEERMGVAVSVDGVSKIIEYSDLPSEVAQQTDAEGNLRLWAGNTAIHAFQVEFLRRVAADGQAFPFHIAHKAVPYLNEQGETIQPDKPNAYKFEQFIFDLLPAAKTSLIVEADRAAEFNPVKNNDGDDSPQTCRAAMIELHRTWLRAAGAVVSDDVPVEIGPLYALDADDVKRRLSVSVRFDRATFLTDR